MATLLSVATRVHTIGLLAGLTALVRSTAIVLLIIGTISMGGVTVDLAGPVLMPTEQTLLLVLFARSNPFDVLTLPVDKVLTA